AVRFDGVTIYDSLDFSVEPTVGVKFLKSFSVETGVALNVKMNRVSEKLVLKVASKSTLKYNIPKLKYFYVVVDYYIMENTIERTMEQTNYNKYEDILLIGPAIKIPILGVFNLDFAMKYNVFEKKNDFSIDETWNFNLGFSIF
uniref:hypothetical protein n=1 Tax=Flammeovirga sp. OC4 TaxID=1382345 RepID=UPI0005C6E158